MSDRPIAANDWKRPGLTPSVIIRRGIFALVAIASLAALALAALPWVASTQLVRNRIAIELSAWSGFRVAIASTPQIEVFPTFKAVLSGVTLYQWGNWDNPAVIEAERVEIDLSPIAALNGNVAFSEAKIINPVIRVGPDLAQPGPDSIMSSGRIAQAVDTVRQLIADNPDKPDFVRFPATPFGSVDIQNGRVVTMVAGQQQDIVTRLNGLVEWPALNAMGQAALSGVWRGEEVKIDLSSPSPLALFAGGATTLTASWDSPPLKGRIDGSVRTASDGLFDLQFNFEAPSVRRAIAWTGAGLATGSALGSLTLAGDLDGTSQLLKVQDGKAVVDKHEGTFALALHPTLERPKIAGSLAFQNVDVQSLVSAFTPLMSYDRPDDPRATSLADRMDFTLDVTAATATVGAVILKNAVGRFDVDQQTAAFKLVEAEAFDGSVSGAMRLQEKLGNRTTAIDFIATDISGRQFGEATSLERIVPDAKGSIEASTSGKGQALDAVLAFANGRITAKFGPGELNGWDLATLVSKTAAGGFFPLTEISRGKLHIDAAELEANVDDGVGRVKKVLVKAGQQTISLSGIMPYAGRGIALSGAVTSLEKISLFNPFGREASFFIGGSWDAPFVSAALPPQLPQ